MIYRPTLITLTGYWGSHRERRSWAGLTLYLHIYNDFYSIYNYIYSIYNIYNDIYNIYNYSYSIYIDIYSIYTCRAPHGDPGRAWHLPGGGLHHEPDLSGAGQPGAPAVHLLVQEWAGQYKINIIQDSSRGQEEELLLPATTGPRSDHIIYENIERGSLNITL